MQSRKKIFIEAKSRNKEDYLNLYLKIDVLLLIEILENFRKTTFTYYGLDPACFLTLSSLAMQASLMKSNKQINLLHDMSVYTEFETNVEGRFTSFVKGNGTFNNNYLSTYDPKKKPYLVAFSQMLAHCMLLFSVINYQQVISKN